MRKSTVRLFSILVVLSMLLAMLPIQTLAVDEVRDGSAEHPYLIGTVEELKTFRDKVNAGQTNICANLTADIDLNNEPWTPIGLHSDVPGTTNFDYEGTFNGDGHVIKNLVVDYTGKDATEDKYELGLFSRILGNLWNLGVENATIKSGTGMRVGVIAGETEYSIIENCYSIGTIELSKPDSNKYKNQYGGIVGEVAFSVVKNCYTSYSRCGRGTFSNCFKSSIENFDVMLASGEMCYKLNHDEMNEYISWRQNIGTDSHPVLDSTHSKVYSTGKGEYTNKISECPAKITMRYTTLKQGQIPELIITDVAGQSYDFNEFENPTIILRKRGDTKPLTTLSNLDYLGDFEIGKYELEVIIQQNQYMDYTDVKIPFEIIDPVASVTINEETFYFKCFDDAFDKAEIAYEPCKIKLIKDVTISNNYVITVSNSDITLDLNGQTLLDNSPAISDDDNGTFYVTQGQFTIDDSSQLKAGRIQENCDGKHYLVCNTNSSKLIISGGTLLCKNEESVTINCKRSFEDKLYLNGGIISNTAANGKAINFEGNEVKITDVTVPNGIVYLNPYHINQSVISGGCFDKIIATTNLIDRLDNNKEFVDLTTGELKLCTHDESGYSIENVKVQDLPYSVTLDSFDDDRITVEETDGLTLGVFVSASEDIGVPTFQWYYKYNNDEEQLIDDATTDSLTLSNGMALGKYEYYCKVSALGRTVKSQSKIINIEEPEVIVTSEDGLTQKRYASVFKAFASVEDGSTLKFLKAPLDWKSSPFSCIEVPAKRFTVEFNGIECEDTNHVLFDFKNLESDITFMDSSEGKTGGIHIVQSDIFKNTGNSKITIESGKYYQNDAPGMSHSMFNGFKKININDGTFKGSETCIFAPKCNITGGNFEIPVTSSYNGITATDFKISGGNFTSVKDGGEGCSYTIWDMVENGYGYNKGNMWFAKKNNLNVHEILNVSVKKLPINFNSIDGNTPLTYGYESGPVLTADATLDEGIIFTLTYQWFVDGTEVKDATSSTFTVPTGLTARDHKVTCVASFGDFSVSKDITVSVAKADPAYTVPTNLEATYGKTLSDVTLPTGFTWNDSGDTSVGNVGNNKFYATYIPTDTSNCNVINNIEVNVKVNPKALDTKSATAKDFAFTGVLTKPTLTVKDGDTTLVEGTDYEITDYTQCIHGGKHTVTVVGRGNYGGTIYVDVNILQATRNAPTGVTPVAETINQKCDGKITGVTSAMEYKLSSEDVSKYKPITGTQVSNLAPADYQVRYKETIDYKASEPTSVTIYEGRDLLIIFSTIDRSYNLTCPWNGSITELPSIPTRTGYDVTPPRWEKTLDELKNIQTDMEVFAIYTPNKYTVTIPTGTGYTVNSSQSNSVDYDTHFTFTVDEAAGYSKTEFFAVKVDGTPLTANEDGSFTIKNVKENKAITVEGIADITPPDVQIKIKENKFKTLLNKLSFGLFFKNSVTVEVTATDKGSGIFEASYFLANSSTPKDELGLVRNSLELKDGKASFTMSAGTKKFVFVQASDNIGHSKMVNSDGVVVYTDSNVIVDTVNYTKLTMDDQQAKLKLNGNTVKEIKHGDEVVDSKYYTVANDGTLTIKAEYLQTLEDGRQELHVKINPLGENYVEAEGNDAPNDVIVYLYIHKLTPDLRILNNLSKVYDGNGPELIYETPSTGELTVEFAKKGTDDYSTEIPKDVGKYTVRISQKADSNYTAATVTQDFEIVTKPVTISGTTAKSKVYDGTDVAEIENVGTLSGVCDGDNLRIKAGTAKFMGPYVGTDITVVFSDFELEGNAKDNYVLNYQPKEIKANITTKELTVNVEIKDKQYDGKNMAEFESAPSLKGVVTGEKVELSTVVPTFKAVAVGTGIEVNVPDFTLTGHDSGNYTLKQPTNVTGNIVNNYNPVKDTDYTVNSNGWQNGDFVVTAKDGFELSLGNEVTSSWVNKFTKSDETTDGKLEFYVRNKATGAISNMVTESYKIDKTAPTAEVTMDKNSWKEFLNNITFGLLFSKNVEIEVKPDADVSGIAKVEYVASDKALSLDDAKELTDWVVAKNNKISVTAEDAKQFVYYIRVTDNAGNVTYLSTDGAEFDMKAPTVSGVEDGKSYCEAKEVTIADKYLDTVTLNDTAVTLTDGKFTVKAAEGEQTIVANDKVGNSTTVKVKVFDGHAWDDGKVTKEATAAEEGEKTFTCKNCGETRVEKIAKLPPEMIDGDNGSYNKKAPTDEGLKFRSNASIKDFIDVYLDGKVVARENYDLKEGSTIVIFKPEFLATLTPGNHTMSINSTTGTATASFAIEEKDPVDETSEPIDETSNKPVDETSKLVDETSNKPGDETSNQQPVEESKLPVADDLSRKQDTKVPGTGASDNILVWI